jgi:hypothetical protein
MTAKLIKDLVKGERTRPFSPFYDIEQWFEDAWKKPLSLLSPSIIPGMRAAERYELTPSVDIFVEGKEVILCAYPVSCQIPLCILHDPP